MRLADEGLLITPTLLQRFVLEAEFEGGDGRYYALIQRANGDMLSHHPGSPMLDTAQLLWAIEVLRKLNRELHHDGAWVVCFTHPAPIDPSTFAVIENPKRWAYKRYCLIWIDQDGDPQFTQEWVAGENSDFTHFAHVVLAGTDSTMQKCEASWLTWRTMMREVLDPQQDQLYRRARGEAAPSAR